MWLFGRKNKADKKKTEKQNSEEPKLEPSKPESPNPNLSQPEASKPKGQGPEKQTPEYQAEKEPEKQKPENPDPEFQEAALTLYACRKGTDIVPEIAKRLLADNMEQIYFTDENEFSIQLKDGTGMQFHMRTDPEETAAQAQGMAHFFSQSPLENGKVKEAALCQIRLFNCIIGIGFLVNGDEERTDYLIRSVYKMADELNAFILYPNMYLYHADGRLLLSIDGKSDFEEYYPQASDTILEREGTEEDVDRERKKRSLAVLKEKGIPYIEHLKASVFESECQIPDKSEIVHRLACVFAASVQSEVYTSGQFEDYEKIAAAEYAQLEERYQISQWLSPEEKEYLEQPKENWKENPSLHNKFGWRYECCAVFLWALSLIEMKQPTEICDAAELGDIMWNHTFESLMEKSVLKSKKEILDFQDLVLRYHWACVDARIHHKTVPELNSDIIYEWHYALNWLVRADGVADWDEVTTTT